MENELLRQVAEATGLPSEVITKELTRIITQNGLDISEVSMDELRQALACYLRDVLIHAKESLESELPQFEEEPDALP